MIPMAMLIDATLARLVFSGAVYFGVACVVLAFVGTREGDRPHCRRCGYELGVDPDGHDPRCPECGRSLAAPGRVVRGRARRRRGLAWSGAAIVALGGVWFGGAAFARIIPASGKPVWWLRADLASALDQDAAAEELRIRLTSGALGPAEQAAIIDAVLRVQGDTDGPWHRSVGDLFVDLARAGAASPDDLRAYARQAVDVDAGVRVRSVIVRDARMLPWQQDRVFRLRADDQGLLLLHMQPRHSVLINGEHDFSAQGSSAITTLHQRVSSRGQISSTIDFRTRNSDGRRVPLTLEPGEHTVEIESAYWITTNEAWRSRVSGGVAPEIDLDDPEVLHRWTTRAQLNFRVSDTTDPGILLTPDAGNAAWYAEHISVERIEFKEPRSRPSDGLGLRMALEFPSPCEGLGLAHRVILIIDDEEHDLGAITIEVDRGAAPCVGGIATEARSATHLLLGTIETGSGRVERVRVVLRADPAAATRTVDMNEILLDEIDLGRHRVAWPDDDSDG